MSKVEFAWGNELPPFDANAGCPKCHGGVDVIFHFTHTEKFPCMGDVTWVLDEHLCRVCRRCMYGWCEATAETKPARDLRAAPGP